MLIKKYEPALLWNANNGSHGSCLPSQNCSGGWTSDFWKRSHLVSGHHSQLPLIMFWCKRQNYERISGWDPVFGKWCHSNSNQKGDSRIWTVWAGRKGNRSPTGTVIYFFFPLLACVSQGWIACWQPKPETGLWQSSRVGNPTITPAPCCPPNTTSQFVRPWRNKRQTVAY